MICRTVSSAARCKAQLALRKWPAARCKIEADRAGSAMRPSIAANARSISSVSSIGKIGGQAGASRSREREAVQLMLLAAVLTLPACLFWEKCLRQIVPLARTAHGLDVWAALKVWRGRFYHKDLAECN